MSLHFLIDGYNVINRCNLFKDSSILQESREALLRMIKDNRLTGSSNNRVTVVFDGKNAGVLKKKMKVGLIDVIFSQNESADETIKKMVVSCRNPKQMVLVSDDKSIILAVRMHGAKVISVNEFVFKGNRSFRAQKSKKASQMHEKKPGLAFWQQQVINRELKKLWV